MITLSYPSKKQIFLKKETYNKELRTTAEAKYNAEVQTMVNANPCIPIYRPIVVHI